MSNNYLRSLVWVLLLFISGSIVAQDEGTQLFRIIDQEDGSPIVFATVVLSNSKVGVISDENGNFRIPNQYFQGEDSLRISCIGYQTVELSLKTLLAKEEFTITLIQKTEALEEVVVKSSKKEKQYGPRKIVKWAIENIPENYPVQPFGHISYYRDYQKIVDTRNLDDQNPLKTAKYVNLNEGILQVFDAGFGTNKFFDAKNQAALLTYGVNRNFLTDSLLAVPYDNYNVKYLKGVTLSPLGGNELYLLNIGNCIRNYDQKSFSFVDIMNKDFLRNHSFWIDKIVFLDDEAIYKIDFVSSIQGMDRYFKGHGSIYIGKADYGIHKLVYTTKDSRKNSILYQVNVEYKKRNNNYYLNYLTFNNYFDVRHGDMFKVENLIYHYGTNTYQIFFNREIDVTTIDASGRTIAFYYKNRKLDIKQISQSGPRHLNISLYPFLANIDRNTVENDISYTIENVYDVDGYLINDAPILSFKQFRELFVQEVFEELPLDPSFNYIIKNKVLSSSMVNSEKNVDRYWVNSPLKESK